MSRHIGYAEESTYGTPVAPSGNDFADVVRETLQMNRAFERLKSVSANSVRQVNLLTESIGGEIELLGNFQDPGMFFWSLYGGVTTTGAGDPRTHTFPPTGGTSTRVGTSLTLEVKRDTAARTARYAGVKVISYNLAASLDASPSLTFGIVAKSEAFGTAATASYDTYAPMTLADTTVSFDNGSTALPATSLNLTMEWPVDAPHQIGSAAFAKEPIDSDNIVVTGEVSMLFEDTEQSTYYAAMYDGSTVVDIEIQVDDGTYSLTHHLNKSRLTAFATNMTGRDRLIGTASFEAYYDAAATENMQTILVNDQDSVGTSTP